MGYIKPALCLGLVFRARPHLMGPPTLARGSLNSSYSYANASEAFPPLRDYCDFPLAELSSIGGQNCTRCCLRAVIDSYQVQNGLVSKRGDSFIALTPDQLSAEQFPCGAAYLGNNSGAPAVTVPYSWCSTNCGGWQQSSNKDLTQWVQPFVGFILPAAVFCLNVSPPTCRCVLW